MSDKKKERLAEIIRRELMKEKGKITAEYLKIKLATIDSSLKDGDFIALSYIINQALEKNPGIIRNLEDFIEHHSEIRQILGNESQNVSSSPKSIPPPGVILRNKKRGKNKIVETQIILNKFVDNRGNIYNQSVNSRSF
ncbi:MAG: hypothetical protein NT166_29275 [Candidatus Aminicenantes bacterium]|nr:hypothetical protein [Candidatus Aminicenantes bacterium]